MLKQNPIRKDCLKGWECGENNVVNINVKSLVDIIENDFGDTDR